MATLKRWKKGRSDQPTLFGGGETTIGGAGGPVVITDPKTTASRQEKDSSALLGSILLIPSKTDGQTANEPAGPSQENCDDDSRLDTESFQRTRSASISARYGRWMPVYHKRTAGEVIDLEGDGNSDDPVRRTRSAYLSRALLVVEVAGDTCDMPDMILVRFHAEEAPAPVRECWRLTGNLFETVLAKCAGMEGGGAMSAADCAVMRQRFKTAAAMYDRLPKTWEYNGDLQ